ncbi:hypothetical protein BH23CHL7_BH23CHL7_16040 [soil metagenome]
MVGLRVFRAFRAVVEEYNSRAAVIAVDMLIGLTDEGGRGADFATAPSSALDCARPSSLAAGLGDRADRLRRCPWAPAREERRLADVRAVRRISEVAEAVDSGAPPYEVHPEVSFRALNGATRAAEEDDRKGARSGLELLQEDQATALCAGDAATGKLSR